MTDWTPAQLTAIVLGFVWTLAFLAYLADRIGPDPWKEPVDRRHG